MRGYTEVLPDIPRLYTAIAEWFACLLYLSQIRQFKLEWKQVVQLGLAFVVQVSLQLLAGSLPLSLWLLGMFINILWMFAVLRYFNQTSTFNTWFTLTKAFILSELLASTGWQLYCILIYKSSFDYMIVEFGFNIAIHLLFIVGLFQLEHKIDTDKFNKILTKQMVWVALYTGIIVFLISNVGFLLQATSFRLGSSHAIFLVRTITNVSGVAILYMVQLHILEQTNKRELSAMNRLFQNQYQQYRAYAQSTHYINQKAHDLKHQIAIILAEENQTKRQAYISKLQDAIHQLSVKVETGNGVLDTILTQKKIYCAEHNINFTCMANGHLLHSLEIMDLCSLFGNALDNAIEHVEGIAEEEKRLITLKLGHQGQMVILRVDNYCIDATIQSGVIPNTSKTMDKDNHGFGLRSIDYIAKKYGGHMTLSVEDNWFSLKVIFPITGK